MTRTNDLRRCVVVVLSWLAAMSGTAVCAAGKYEPTWESLNSRPCPAWFTNAKFGIFIHWGVYSVPSWSPKGTYSEWYLHQLRQNSYKGATRKFHERVFGKDFKYEQFAPMFRCELFNPDEWAEIFRRSGAKYVVLTSKHHDGYCLWKAPDSPNWNSVEVGPKRDLCGDLAGAVRAKGLKMGYYYSLYEWYNPVYRQDLKRYVAEHMLPQLKDLVTRHKPALIFSDGEWSHPHEAWRSTEFLAWLFNEGPNRDEVVVDDRWGKGMRHKCGSYYTTEYEGTGGPGGKQHPWEECRGIGRSFGYNRNENIFDYSSRTESVRTLVQIVSNGGNLLLDIGPTADGRIPVIMQDRLITIGKWLAVYGEAVYGTTAGPFRIKASWGRATTKGNKLYLHLFEWPKDGRLSIPGIKNKIAKAWCLADPTKSPLKVTRADGGTTVIDLAGHHPQPHVTVVGLELDGKPDIDDKIYPRPDGTVRLEARTAQIHGRDLRVEKGDVDGGNLGSWTDRRAWAGWDFVAAKPGKYVVSLRYACEKGNEGSTFVVTVGDQKLQGKIAEHTGGWTKYKTMTLGEVMIDKKGGRTCAVKPVKKPRLAVMNLKWIELSPAK